MAKTRILIVEDESIVAKDVQNTLKSLGYEVCGIVSTGKDSIKTSEETRPDLVLMDIVLRGDVDGIRAAEEIYKTLNIPIVYLTAYADNRTLQRAKVAQPFGYILKPFEERELHTTIEMALHSHKMEVQLKKERDKAQMYLDVAGVLIVVIGQDRKIKLINKKGCEILGYKSEAELIGKDWFENFIPERIRDDIIEIFNQTISDKAGESRYGENPIKSRTGEERILAWHTSLLRDEKGQVSGAISSGEDITERVKAAKEIQKLNEELEKRVIERTAQLEAANKDLEAFSYSVSHDLQTPLRAIDGFSKALLEDCGEMLDKQGRRHVETIQKNTKRMAQLIKDLLLFSQFGKQEMRVTDIDMNMLVTSVLEELKQSASRRKIAWMIDSLPSAHGDKSMIRQVLQNLVSNALKFTKSRRPAEIEIKGKTEKKQNVYWIRDNGIGFDSKYSEKLFGVFKRLHSPREYEGAGVGLAIAERIIQKHGGKIWAEGEVDKGATFYFSLPE